MTLKALLSMLKKSGIHYSEVSEETDLRDISITLMEPRYSIQVPSLPLGELNFIVWFEEDEETFSTSPVIESVGELILYIQQKCHILEPETTLLEFARAAQLGEDKHKAKWATSALANDKWTFLDVAIAVEYGYNA